LNTVLRYFRSGHDWHPGSLTTAQVESLSRPSPDQRFESPARLSAEDEAIVHNLLRDGRTPIKQLAEETGMSVPTTRRRLDSLLDRGLVRLRTEVVPTVFGLGLEVLVWCRAPSASW